MPTNQAFILGVLAIAVAMDVRTGRVRNWLTLPAVALGPLVCLGLAGGYAALTSLACIAVVMAIGLVVHSGGLLGGADVKLLAAVAALGAVPDGFLFLRDTLLFTALAGGVQAVALLVWQRRAAATARQLGRAVWLKAGLGVTCLGETSGRKIPYSIAIAAGTVCAMHWRP